jgi:hypothetical protein
MDLLVQMRALLEYWSIGVLEKMKARILVELLLPLLHHSITPADYREKERLLNPSMSSPKPGLLDPNSLFHEKV